MSMKPETIISRLEILKNWLKRNGFPGAKPAVTALQEAIKLIQRQEEVIRCKECENAVLTADGKYCKYCYANKDDHGYTVEVYHDADWFCADGKRKKGEQDA